MLETKLIFKGVHKNGFYSPSNFFQILNDLARKGKAKIADQINLRLVDYPEPPHISIYNISGVTLIYKYGSNPVCHPESSLTLTGEKEAVERVEKLFKSPLEARKQ